jgi:hypothetical protein
MASMLSRRLLFVGLLTALAACAPSTRGAGTSKSRPATVRLAISGMT